MHERYRRTEAHIERAMRSLGKISVGIDRLEPFVDRFHQVLQAEDFSDLIAEAAAWVLPRLAYRRDSINLQRGLIGLPLDRLRPNTGRVILHLDALHGQPSQQANSIHVEKFVDAESPWSLSGVEPAHDLSSVRIYSGLGSPRLQHLEIAHLHVPLWERAGLDKVTPFTQEGDWIIAPLLHALDTALIQVRE